MGKGVHAMGDRLYENMFLQSEEEPKKEWYMVGFSTDDPNAFQGFHKENILFIVDEGAGVSERIYEAIEGSLNTENSRILAIGNPTDPQSYFGKLFLTREGADWNKLHIDCEQSPNVLAGKNVIPQLCSWDWPEKMRKKWGENDPRYSIRVKGEFPERAINSIVSYPVAAAALVSDGLEILPERKLILAVDVAREGDDLSVFLLREKGQRDYLDIVEEDVEQTIDEDEEWLDINDSKEVEADTEEIETEPEELAAIIMEKLANNRNPDIVREVVKLLREYPNIEDVAIDAVGVGGPALDDLEEMQFEGEEPCLDGINFFAVCVGEASSDPKEYLNMRAELADMVKEDMENEVLLLESQDIVDQVTTMAYRYDERNRFVVMSKEKFKRDYKRSPDEWDALTISYAPRIIRKKQPAPNIRSL